MFMKVKLTNTLNAIAGRKPTIDRQNFATYNKKGKYYAVPSASVKFLHVTDGLHIRYCCEQRWNLYRIVFKTGKDFVLHEAGG